MKVDGTLSVALGTLGRPELTGSGMGSSAGGVGTAFTVPAGLLSLTQPVDVFITPPAIGLSLIRLTASPASPVENVAGSFGPMTGLPEGGTLGGAMGNNGIARLFFGPQTTSTTPCVGHQCALAGTVPLNYLGGGGEGMAVVAGLPVTVVGAVWNNLGVNETTPTRTFKVQKVAAGIPVTVTATAWDKRTANGAGSVQLVAPAVAKLSAGVLGALPVVGVLTLEFEAPEPGMLLLGGSAVLALVALARRSKGD